MFPQLSSEKPVSVDTIAPIFWTQRVHPENLCPRTQTLPVHCWLRPLLLDVGIHLCENAQLLLALFHALCETTVGRQILLRFEKFIYALGVFRCTCTDEC